MNGVNPSLNIELLCRCPECGYGIDLMECDDNGVIKEEIESGNKDVMYDIVYNCDNCKNNFRIGHVK